MRERSHFDIDETIYQNVKIHIDKMKCGEYTIEKHIFSVRSAQHYQSFYYISEILCFLRTETQSRGGV